jgi:hypothetical protein
MLKISMIFNNYILCFLPVEKGRGGAVAVVAAVEMAVSL